MNIIGRGSVLDNLTIYPVLNQWGARRAGTNRPGDLKTTA